MMEKSKGSSKNTSRKRSKSSSACDKKGGESCKKRLSPQKKEPKKRENCILRQWARVLLWVGLVFCALCVLLTMTAEIYVGVQSSKKHGTEAGNLPSGYVGLVLGCPPKLGKYENEYFTNRIKKAAELWRSGNVRCLIVSGDNRATDYNEPEEMKKALVMHGVPAKYIVCDYAGLRTLDSVVRAHKIFGADKIAIVSQEFHNKRALAIASHNDIEARALDAEDAELTSSQVWSWLRERVARGVLLVDLFLIEREPRFMGPPVSLPPPPDRRSRGSYISF